MWRRAFKNPLLWVALLTILAFVARLHQLGEPVLRWDEGWSLAHASLSWAQLWQVAAEEWHPPLYVAMLKLWLVTGKTVWGIRFLSVLLGVIAVPLMYMVARSWSSKTRIAILAAGFAALWPLLVYYGQVTRMYPLSALAVLAAAWFILRGEAGPDWRNDLGLVLSAAVALYTLYYTAWVLLGLWLYAALLRLRLLPRLIATGAGMAAAYLPWLLVARTTWENRLGSGPAMGTNPILGTIEFLKPTIGGLAFVYGSGWHVAAVVGIVLVAGLLVGEWKRSEVTKLLLPLLAVGISAVLIAYSAQASRWFAVRHLVPASPFLALALAWAMDRLASRWWPLLPIVLLALGMAYWPASTRFVYEKTLEVVDPFDPTEDYRYLTGRAAPGDLIYFNVLARAGWYENLRQPQDPAWSYAMRWDPIIEPMERIAARIARDQAHRRLWFALYKGSFGPNAPLKEWLDSNLYPAGGEWRGDMLYLAYAKAADPGVRVLPAASPPVKPARDDLFVNGIRLKSAEWTATARAGGVCTLSLVWEAERPVTASYKVFVHATDPTGRPIAQHDAIPSADNRPTNSWQPGVEVLDRHGLFLPMSGLPSGTQLRVGFYDAKTGERLRLTDGRDAIELGTLTVDDDG